MENRGRTPISPPNMVLPDGGGFPESCLAENDTASLNWRWNFIRTYLEKDIPLFGPHIPAETLRRLWTMLAHNQGALLDIEDFNSLLGHPVVGGSWEGLLQRLRRYPGDTENSDLFRRGFVSHEEQC